MAGGLLVVGGGLAGLVATHELVRQVSRDGALFSSRENTATTGMQYLPVRAHWIIDMPRRLIDGQDRPGKSSHPSRKSAVGTQIATEVGNRERDPAALGAEDESFLQ